MSDNLDKFYTSDAAARTFISLVTKHVNLDDFDNIIEPSAGAGALLNHLPSRTIGVDLVPERDDIIQCDFFDFEYPVGRNITIGNPPFGKRSKLAVDFFKKAALHSDVVAFIIPVTWEKYSIHKQLPEGWALRVTERLPELSFEMDGKPYRVRCCMQIWAKSEELGSRLTSRPTGINPYFDFVKADDCEFAVRQAYPKTVRKEDITSTQSYYFIKPKIDGVWEVFESINWQSVDNRELLGGTSVPILDRDTVVRFYEKHMNLRITDAPPVNHPDFQMWQFNRMPGSDKVFENEFDFAVLRQGFGDYSAKVYDADECDRRKQWALFKANNPEALDRLMELNFDALSKLNTKTPGFGKADVVKAYVDLRKMKEEVGVHSDFTFVTKDDDWDFCMSSSPCIVRSREYFEEKGGKFCTHFIKAHVPDLFETFNTIAWQSAEAKKYLSGIRFPTADTVEIVLIYSLFKHGKIPSKKGDWRKQKEQAKVRKKHNYRKTEPEPSTHPDFIISSRYNPKATFVIRGVRPVVSDEVDIYSRISDNTRYYSVQPLVDGVREVFDRIDWSKYWSGVSMPTVSIPDCIEIYNKEVSNERAPETTCC